MKKILRYLAAMMVAIMVTTCMQPAYMAQASATQYDENYIFTDKFEAVEYLNEGFKAHNGTVQFILSPSLYTDCSAYDAFLEILNLTPYYYEAGGASISYGAVTGGTRFKVTPKYKYDEAEHQKLNAEISKIIDGLDLDGKSEYQKARAIHDYICDNVNYDFTYTKRSAYDAIFDGEVVCQGYATLFYIMCEEAGLNSDVIVGLGNGGGHAWNIVEIGGEYYNVDTTWDGSYDTTHHTYFLNNDADFEDHVREAEFLTEEYYARYPMADYSWVDYSDLDNSKADIANLTSDTFTTIDGGTVTNQAELGKSKILIFGSTTNAKSQSNINNVSLANLTDVDVVFMEINQADLSTVTSFKNTYGNGNSKIKYAYSTDSDIDWMMWDYVEATLDISQIYIPFIVFIDANNRIQYYSQGENISTQTYEDYTATYLEHRAIATLSKDSLSIKYGNSEKLTVKIYGQTVNPQFVTWTSSNSSVAAVDYNGVVKGIKAGTATITCKVNDKLSYTCKVTVTDDRIPDGLNKGTDGLWGYYKDGKLDTTFTGLAANAYGTWYIVNGRINTKFTGLYKYNNKWQYINKGKLDATYTGAATNAYGTWYMENGSINTKFTGLYKYNNKWQYFANGKLNATYTGLADNAYGTWYMENGSINTKYTGFYKYNGNWYYISNGKLDTTYTGLYKCDGKWKYFEKGKLNATYTGVATNDYGTWYMENGSINTKFTGLYKYEGRWQYFASGKLNATYTGIAKNDYGTWYVKNGKIASTYNGKVTINGVTYTIKNGKVV